MLATFELPRLGFGTSPFRSSGRLGGAEMTRAVTEALAVGYRLFDLAELYGTERAVGRALRQPGSPPRDELFLVGKVWRTNFRPAQLRQACENSLRRLGVDHFDLYLLHAPEAWCHRGPLVDPEEAGWEELERLALPRDAQGQPLLDEVPLRETWEALLELSTVGFVRHAGVSNFNPTQLASLGPQPSRANQIASSPFDPNEETVAYCHHHHQVVMVHSPLSPPGLLADPRLQHLAHDAGTTAAALVLRWHQSRGLVPLPCSTHPNHLRANYQTLHQPLEPNLHQAITHLRREPPTPAT